MYLQNDTYMFIEHIFIHVITKFRYSVWITQFNFIASLFPLEFLSVPPLEIHSFPCFYGSLEYQYLQWVTEISVKTEDNNLFE